MPCFLAGASPGAEPRPCAGRTLYAFSHQQGASGRGGLVCRTDGPAGPAFLAWHLSGGTTELLRAEPEGTAWLSGREILGGTTDISAGQLIDRTGVLLGLQFPAGKALDALSGEADTTLKYRVKAGRAALLPVGDGKPSEEAAGGR